MAGRSKKLVGKIEVKPHKRSRIALGEFSAGKQPRGFSVKITPNPDPAGSVVTRTSALGTPRQYRLVMHISNNGSRAVMAEVKRL